MDTKAINTIRVLAADVVQKANSGHPGAPMGCAPIAHVLWGELMNYNPKDPHWINRDRFVLSNGHACALQYVMLHLSGYDLSMDELKRFRQLHSKTPGHPEAHLTPGVEVSTGPLGQGLANAVGMAIAQAHLAATFNKPDFELFNNFTYVICGDGCLQEGITSEAASLAGHLGLGHLIVMYDDNHITIDGETELAFTEDVPARFAAYGWHVQCVDDVESDLAGLRAALAAARAETRRPSLIKVRTTIGYGSSKQGTEKVHGAPLGADDVAQVKRKFGFDPAASFVVDDDVRRYYEARARHGAEQQAAWQALLDRYVAAFPDLGADLKRWLAGTLPATLAEVLPKYGPDSKALATRQHGSETINAIAKVVPELIGGSADLNPSTLTYLKASAAFQRDSPHGRNIHFGVREHAMAAICNGMAAYGALRPFCSTFLNFIEYCLPSVRLSALSHHSVLYIMTHDSVGLGEDGPTHQPIEIIPGLRAMPNLSLWRPADGNETNAAYLAWLRSHGKPFVVCLSRQTVPVLAGSSMEAALRGAYVLQAESGPLQLVLVGTGSEVGLTLEAAKLLGGGVRVVSMPSVDVFHAQDAAYRASVLPPGIPALAVEAAATFGWHSTVHAAVGIDRFGASAPAADVFRDVGLTKENVADTARRLMARFAPGAAPPVGNV